MHTYYIVFSKALYNIFLPFSLFPVIIFGFLSCFFAVDNQMPQGEPPFHASNQLEKPVHQTRSQTVLSAPISGITGDSASSALPASASKSSLAKQSRNTEKVRHHNVGGGRSVKNC
jgi:hypothetical protein